MSSLESDEGYTGDIYFEKGYIYIPLQMTTVSKYKIGDWVRVDYTHKWRLGQVVDVITRKENSSIIGSQYSKSYVVIKFEDNGEVREYSSSFDRINAVDPQDVVKWRMKQ